MSNTLNDLKNDLKTSSGNGTGNNTKLNDSANGGTESTANPNLQTGSSRLGRGMVSSTISPLHCTMVSAPTHLKLAAGSLMYDRKYDVDDIPELDGAASMFNKFSSIKYYMCGTTDAGYDPRMHFDMDNPATTVLSAASTSSTSTPESDSGSSSSTVSTSTNGTSTTETITDKSVSEEKDKNAVKKDVLNLTQDYGAGLTRWDDIIKAYYNNYDLFNSSKSATEVNTLAQYLSISNSDKPTAKNIIEASHQKTDSNSNTTRMPYDWNDFIYCKWYGKIPNNRLITLRRYMFPVDDIATNHENQLLVPIAQAITYFGEGTGNTLSSLLKMSWGLNWTEIESKVQDVDGNEKGWGQGIEGVFGGNKLVTMTGAVAAFARGAGIPGTDANARWDGSGTVMNNWLKKAYTDDGAYWNVVLGPVNVVNKTHRRERGFKWSNDISIKFTFSLRSYYGVNPRVALIDIMSNMLRLTNNNGKWWGGATRYFPNMQHKVGFLGNQELFYKSDWEGYFKSVRDEVAELGTTLLNRCKNIDLPDFAAIKNRDWKGFFESLKNFASSFMGNVGGQAMAMAMGKLASADRPELLSIRSLLEGRPVGEWHLTIGNPLNPIAVMGNMLVDGCDFEVSEELGLDDFPTEITFTVKLKHARPREVGDIESMFNMGFGRISYTPLIAGSTEFNTFGSASTETQESDKKHKAEYLAAQEKLMNELKRTDDRSTFTGDPSTVNNTHDAQYYIDSSNFTVKSIQSKIQHAYGEAWSKSSYLLTMIQKSKLKS